MLKPLRALLLSSVSLLSLSSALAVPAVWSGSGQAPITASFTVATSGVVEAYYTGLAGGFTNLVGVQVNGVDSPSIGLNNHATPYGSAFAMATVSAGDVLVFYVDVTDTGTNQHWRFYTDPGLNADGVNHAWATPYAGDVQVPAGINIAFEDLAGGGDLNYQDHSFTFRIAGAVPEPASSVMMLLGVAGLAGLRRREQR